MACDRNGLDDAYGHGRVACIFFFLHFLPVVQTVANRYETEKSFLGTGEAMERIPGTSEFTRIPPSHPDFAHESALKKT